MRKGYLCFKMSSCVTIDENPDSAIKLRFSMSSKADKILTPLPTEEKSVNGDPRIAGLGFKSLSSPQLSSLPRFGDFGNKEETFFDSQPWLDSDCDDEFFSVNGEFTPSRGNTPSRGTTPNHQSGFTVTPQLNKSPSMDGAPGNRTEAAPTDKKKTLVELFLESFRSHQDADFQTFAVNQSISNGKLEPKLINLDLPPRSTNGTPYAYGFNSICSSERTLHKDLKPQKKKSARAAQCCLPSFVWGHNLSYAKKRLSLGPVGEGSKQ